jgi:hypothetical protein
MVTPNYSKIHKSSFRSRSPNEYVFNRHHVSPSHNQNLPVSRLLDIEPTINVSPATATEEEKYLVVVKN